MGIDSEHPGHASCRLGLPQVAEVGGQAQQVAAEDSGGRVSNISGTPDDGKVEDIAVSDIVALFRRIAMRCDG